MVRRRELEKGEKERERVCVFVFVREREKREERRERERERERERAAGLWAADCRWYNGKTKTGAKSSQHCPGNEIERGERERCGCWRDHCFF